MIVWLENAYGIHALFFRSEFLKYILNIAGVNISNLSNL